MDVSEKFASTFGIDAGIAFALGGSRRDGDDARELSALLVEGCNALSLSVESCGIAVEELRIVVSIGLAECSVISG